MLLNCRVLNLPLYILGLLGVGLYLLSILFSLVLHLLKLALDLGIDLGELLLLSIRLLKSLLELRDLLLIVFLLTLEDEDGVVLELLLRHLLESLHCLSDGIDVLHESLADIVSADGQSLPAD